MSVFNKIANNKFLDALVKLVFLSAAIHLSVLIYVSIIRLDPRPLNFFSIISLDTLLPGISEGLHSQLLSLFLVIGLYCTILFLSNKKKT